MPEAEISYIHAEDTAAVMGDVLRCPTCLDACGGGRSGPCANTGGGDARRRAHPAVQCLGHPDVTISESAPCPECGAVPADWFLDVSDPVRPGGEV